MFTSMFDWSARNAVTVPVPDTQEQESDLHIKQKNTKLQKRAKSFSTGVSAPVSVTPPRWSTPQQANIRPKNLDQTVTPGGATYTLASSRTPSPGEKPNESSPFDNGSKSPLRHVTDLSASSETLVLTANEPVIHSESYLKYDETIPVASAKMRRMSLLSPRPSALSTINEEQDEQTILQVSKQELDTLKNLRASYDTLVSYIETHMENKKLDDDYQKREFKLMNSLISNYSSECTRYRKELQQTQKKAEKIRSKFDSFREENEMITGSLSDNNQELHEELKRSQSDLARYKDMKAHFEDRLKVLTPKIEQLTKDRQAFELKQLQMQSLADDLKQQLAKSNQEMSRVMDKLAQTCPTLTDKDASLSNVTDAVIRKILEEKANAIDVEVSLNKRMSEIDAELSQKKAQVSSLQSELCSSQNRIKDLKESLIRQAEFQDETTQKMIDQHANLLSELQLERALSELKSSRSERSLQTQHQENARLSRKLLDLEQVVRILQSENDGLRYQVQDSKRDASTREHSTRHFELENSILKRETVALNQKLNEMIAESASLRHDKQIAQTENAQLREEISRLHASGLSANSDVQEIELQTFKEKYEHEIKNLKTSLAEKIGEVHHLSELHESECNDILGHVREAHKLLEDASVALQQYPTLFRVSNQLLQVLEKHAL